MIKLQTTIKVPQIPVSLNWGSTVCSIGSCFSEHLIKYFDKLGMNTTQNPSGIIYNTHSIAKIMQRVATCDIFTQEEFFKHNNLYKSWEHHGRFSNPDLIEAVNIANINLVDFLNTVRECDLFIITPSSSVVYKLKETNEIVANCHRVPNNQFERTVLSTAENSENLQSTINSIQTINPNCRIVLTLSPVRHYPGDLTLNSLSKARLLDAIHQVVETNQNVHYFPSYEIVLDELRDYRFFESDMLHPSELARQVIFQRFIETTFSDKAIAELPDRIKQAKRNNHRPRTQK